MKFDYFRLIRAGRQSFETAVQTDKAKPFTQAARGLLVVLIPLVPLMWAAAIGLLVWR